MVVLHELSDFSPGDRLLDDSTPTSWYEGQCPHSGELLKLPRTRFAEAIAQGFMQHLAIEQKYAHEGKMYGILLVKTPTGEQRVLKAFSGLLQGQPMVAGWVPPIPGRDRVALAEAQTLAALDAIKQELIALHHIPERQQYHVLSQEFESQLQALASCHQQRKHERQQRRQQFCETLTAAAAATALEQLDEESRRDGIERRQLKRQRDAQLAPLKQVIEQVDARMRSLKQQRKELSRELQALMHTTYCLTNFSGQSLPLHQLMPGGTMPTGTGDCCAPKLLHYAATHHLKPLAMAEFWWGPPTAKGDKVQGAFYGACAERCQPLMGFLLSGLPGLSQSRSTPAIDLAQLSLPVLYEDTWIIAVNKPAGLLSVPGRRSDRQDSVLTRLRHLLPDGDRLMAVHRLDQDTSGILLLARDKETYCQLSQQFQQRLVKKVYEAILSGWIALEKGVIDLPLVGDPENRPYQQVDWQRGKPSITRFQVIARLENYTRVKFIPETGRSHQLRVHAADARGLGVPILGDRLYGAGPKSSRLHLHARELCFQHPQSGCMVSLLAETPF